MGNYDFEEELSDSDNDDFLRGDTADISSAFLPSPSSIPAAGAGDFAGADEEEDDDDDDLELVRSIKEQYGVGDDISNPMSLKPLSTLPPVDSDDEEDDFETLRAIQRRFSQYGDGSRDLDDATQSKSEICVDKSSPDDVTCTNLENESVDVCTHDREQGHCNTSESGATFNQTSSFPEAAQTFIEAIKKNRSCQKFLRSKLLHIEARMEEIKALQMKIKTVKDYQVKCRKVIGRASSQKEDPRIQLISVPKQRPDAKGGRKTISPMCYGPVENSHVASLSAALKKFPLSIEMKKWSKEESEDLEKGIVQQLQKMLIEKSADVLSDDIISSIKNLEITPEIIRNFAGKVNWEELASTYLPRRSGAECEARWFNHEDRLINKGDWTSMEEKQLLLLIQNYGFHNWVLIAEKLKTNRTPFKCLEHYQRSLNASILKREWTEDEDAQLRSAVERYGESNWQVVADSLDGRTGTQCSNRWNKTLHPARKRVGKWSDDEDKRLKVAATLFGHKNWHKIAQFVPGRTQAQCRERWVNVLDPSLKLGEWTEEEDLKLKTAIVEHGYCWSRIATCVPSRTDNQCRRRWKKLFPDEVPLLQAAKRLQKVALISNFVDRESERPAIGPNDFVPLPIEGSVNEPQNNNLPQKRKKSRKSKKSDSGKEAATCISKKDQSRKRRKRAKSPEIEMSIGNGDAVRNRWDHIVTYKRKRTSKSGSKEMVCSGSINVVVEPKKKPGNTSKEAQTTETRDCGNRARSPEIGMTSDVTDAEHSDGDDVMRNRKRLTHKSGSKRRKRSESIGIATKCKKKSSESKKSDGTEGTQTWDMPIKIWSRRARGVCSKKIAPLSGSRMVQATSIGTNDKGTIKSKPTLEEENNDPEIQHDKPSSSNSESKMSDNDDIEDEIPTLDDLTMKASSSKLKRQRRAASESSERKTAKRQRKESKSHPYESEKWEDLPLAALISKGGASCKQRKSKTSFRHPVCA